MPETIFLRLLAPDDKAPALAEAIAALRDSQPSPLPYAADPASFRQIPGAPFAYWVSEPVRQTFTKFPTLEGERFDAKQGLATADDFRFVRAWWEVSSSKMGVNAWANFAKGGAHSKYYSDPHLLADWMDEGHIYAQSINPKSGKPYSNIWMLNDTKQKFFFRPALTWPRRTNGFSVRIMPAGCIFADKGPAVFRNNDDRQILLSIIHSEQPAILLFIKPNFRQGISRPII